jgi:hypothetical protein
LAHLVRHPWKNQSQGGLKMKTRTFVSILVLVLALLLFTITCENEPAIETIEWEPDGSGFRQYKTNDSQYYDWAFWYWKGTSYQNPLTAFTVEAEAKRISGCGGYGVSIIFCLQDTQNFYVLDISTYGSYNVYKRLNGSWEMIIGWTFSNYINTGYNVINNLKVTYDGANTFTIYLNGSSVDSFTDSSFSGGNAGYLVDIADEDCENFPDEPVDVRYRMLQPVTDP